MKLRKLDSKSVRRRWAAVMVVAVVTGLSLSGTVGVSPAAAAEPAPGFWSPTEPVSDPPLTASEGLAARLSDGKVLRIHRGLAETSSWIFDPTTDQWTVGGTPGSYGQLRTATLVHGPGCGLHCDRVLAHFFLQDAWLLYDPPTKAWLPAAKTNYPRTVGGGAATLIQGSDCAVSPRPARCGNVFLLGGHNDNGDLRSKKKPELWDPSTGLWSEGPELTPDRSNQGQIALANGDILVVGGNTGNPPRYGGDPEATNKPTSDAQRYSFKDNTWTSAGTTQAPAVAPGLALLADGRVLVDYLQREPPYQDIAEIYDPSDNTWSDADPCPRTADTLPKGCGALVTLSDGKVLAATGGGIEHSVFDPVSQSWSSAAPGPSIFSSASTLTLLEGSSCGRHCGKVLRTDGESAELYTPGPSITALSPAVGSVLGGTRVEVTGRFIAEGTPTVRFDGVEASSVAANPDGTLTVTSPPHGLGKVQVTVTTPGGTSGFVPAGLFGYIECTASQRVMALGDTSDAWSQRVAGGPASAGLLGFGLLDGGLGLSAWATAATQRWRRRTRAPDTGPEGHRGRRLSWGLGGFTLVELLVVVVVLGILSAVVVFAVRGAGDKGQKAAVQTDERTIRNAMEVFCAQNGRYPSQAAELVPKYLSNPSEYHVLQTAPDDASFPAQPPDTPPVDPQGNCPGNPSRYKLIPIEAPVARGPCT